VLEAVPALNPRVVEGESYAGSGALPIKAIPSRVVEMHAPGDVEVGELARRLRTGDVPVFVRVHDDRLYADPRTLQEGEAEILVTALAAALAD
jgi:seryl-tRNA(Sec) selenium transferase